MINGFCNIKNDKSKLKIESFVPNFELLTARIALSAVNAVTTVLPINAIINEIDLFGNLGTGF